MVSNDYNFWNNYLNKTIFEIARLIDNKKTIYTDFHIHTDYSADGKQSLSEVINRARKVGIDIIAITDHDSIDVCNDLYEYIINNKNTFPLIIPGVEFTVENNDYGSQCHILQLMINPKEENLIKNVEYNKKALWHRIKLQFKRISENAVLQYYINKYKILCTESDFKEFLKRFERPIPEYNTLMQYIQSKMIENRISNWDIFKLLEEHNQKDCCIERKSIKEARYKILKERYCQQNDSKENIRFLHSMLAVKGADDDDFQSYPSEGSLSVNYFNELKVNEINKNHLTVIAHPSQNKINLINKLIELNDNICGVENNKQCKYSNHKLLSNKAKELKLIQIIGSDSHTLENELYDDIDFYRANKDELKKFIMKANKYINIQT